MTSPQPYSVAIRDLNGDGSAPARCWDRKTAWGTAAQPGIYFIDLLAHGERVTRRAVLIR